jgi:crossover junction endodeoxyribonuclease RuvC
VTVLAIDPSLSGCAVVIAASLTPAYSQRFVTKPAAGVLARVHRYRSIAEPILALAREHTPRLVLIEGYSFGSKGGQSFDRAELGGILRDRLCDLAPVIEVPPSSLKKWATGKGNAQKAEVVSAVSRRFDRSFTNDDEADAFALAMLGLAILTPSEWSSIPKAQLEVASKLSTQVHELIAAFDRQLRGAA